MPKGLKLRNVGAVAVCLLFLRIVSSDILMFGIAAGRMPEDIERDIMYTRNIRVDFSVRNAESSVNCFFNSEIIEFL